MHRAVSKAASVVFAACLLSAAAAAQTTWHVDASQPACPGSGTPADPFCTIGAAIAAASPGDTIQVAAGTYFESVVIDKNALMLLGAGADVTTIVADPASMPVGPDGFVELPSFTIEGFRVTTSDPAPEGIRGCLIEDVGIGIWANDAYGGA
jgi:pectin methylesterase-like acyl-CoA thioesterase